MVDRGRPETAPTGVDAEATRYVIFAHHDCVLRIEGPGSTFKDLMRYFVRHRPSLEGRIRAASRDEVERLLASVHTAEPLPG